jgi:superfamily II DNA or RNA helicase
MATSRQRGPMYFLVSGLHLGSIMMSVSVFVTTIHLRIYPHSKYMAPKSIVKSKDKLTDAEKKKAKAENKVKANPEKSKQKEVKNLERQYKRGQIDRPEAVKEKELAKKQAAEKAAKDKAKAELVKQTAEKAAADKVLRVAADKVLAVQKAKDALNNKMNEEATVADAKDDATVAEYVVVEIDN